MSKDYSEELRRYYEEEQRVIASLPLAEISEAMNIFESARKRGARIYICGNGGSAATASHFCCDFNKGVSMSVDRPYRLECLNDNVPTMMAIANDIGYEDVFSFPLKGKLTSDDVVVGISGSGNSSNVVNALRYASEIGAITVGLVGYDGGLVKKIADHCIHIPIDNMQIVEDLHMIMDHSMMFVLSNQEV